MEANSSKESILFTPEHFLRCHSKQKKDSADVQTQVWLCAFEPSISSPHRNTDVVATCGGNSICFVNFINGKVERKFYADHRENFLTLTWTTVRKEYNVLVAAGSIQTIYFILPDPAFCMHDERLDKSIIGKTTGITFVLFHPVHTNILYCSCSDGQILVFDMGSPSPPEYLMSLKLIHRFRANCELFMLVYYLEREILMASSDDGVYSFYANPTDILKNESKNFEQTLIQFPGHSLVLTESPSLVDSIEMLENGLVASKCALRGAIYVWNVEKWLFRNSKDSKNVVRVKPLYELIWSHTDNYFMYMGYDKGSKILACGDDKGTLWIYDLTSIVKKKETSDAETTVIKPTCLFEWPNLHDPYASRKRKLNMEMFDIVINKIAVSYKGNYLVAVTNNNMVCVWKRQQSIDT